MTRATRGTAPAGPEPWRAWNEQGQGHAPGNPVGPMQDSEPGRAAVR